MVHSKIWLYSNLITEIENYAFSDLKLLSLLDMSNNPINCNCYVWHLIKNFTGRLYLNCATENFVGNNCLILNNSTPPPVTTPAYTSSLLSSSKSPYISTLNALKLERSSTDMKCLLNSNQIVYNTNVNTILKTIVNWIGYSKNTSLPNANNIFNSTIYYDSIKRVFYSNLPLKEWPKHINKEVWYRNV